MEPVPSTSFSLEGPFPCYSQHITDQIKKRQGFQNTTTLHSFDLSGKITPKFFKNIDTVAVVNMPNCKKETDASQTTNLDEDHGLLTGVHQDDNQKLIGRHFWQRMQSQYAPQSKINFPYFTAAINAAVVRF